ncbi:MAG: cytochrome c oxidase accessory protein CcoG [Candidatus Brocadiaceae bacterium]|nr:cytochrome c oxidase accessory protein CcoG [Candidatus Brocadiaceae bacterium]
MTENVRVLSKYRPGTFQSGAHRINPYPKSVRGFYRRYRTIVQIILMIMFFSLPWITIHGLPAILIDLINRKFVFFGLSFRGHDSPLLFYVFASFSLGLAFATSIWGRIWCGWVCPQTVIIDGIFRKTEVLIEGNRIARKKLRESPFNLEKIIKKSFKWFLFFLVSSVLCHTFFAYFVGAENLAKMSSNSPFKNWVPFLIVSITTVIVLLNFGWYREQLCITVCPYGRLQSVLMDENSLVVVYDEKRGEPRKGSVPEHERTGDCINCFNCVKSCPTGIDIRRGVQMECIACTACIDACDAVMQKMKKPKGLIRYDSENGLTGKTANVWRMRTCIYSGFILASCIGLFFSVFNRPALDITFIRAQESPYQVFNSSNEPVMITNHYKIYLKNQSSHTLDVDFDRSETMNSSQIEIIAPAYPATLLPGESLQSHIFLKFPESILGEKGQKMFCLQIITTSDTTAQKYPEEITLVGPVNSFDKLDW